jgi:predicted SnoaL-like aldol condensation-catalyzing enzyme
MSHHSGLFHQIAATVSANGPYPIADWFTEDFRLHDPDMPNVTPGHAGAREMMDKFRSLGAPIHLEVADIIEHDDRAAVRWHLSATRDGAPLRVAIMAMYRFDNDRIAEDWGIAVAKDWP